MAPPYAAGATGIGPRDNSLARDFLGDTTVNALSGAWRRGALGLGSMLMGDEGGDPTNPPTGVASAPRSIPTPSAPGAPPKVPVDLTPTSRIARAAAPPTGEPMMGPPGTISRAARNLSDSYKTPEWNGVGGGPRSAAQMEQDLGAHNLIDRGYRQAVDQNNLEDAVRGNGMDQTIAARKRDLAFEDLMPMGAEPHIRFSNGSSGMMDYADQRAPEVGLPTMGEARQQRSLIAQAAAKQNPKDVAEAALGMGRGRIAEELSLLKQQLDQQVARAAGTPSEAKVRAAAADHYQSAVETAKTLAEIIKAGYPSQPDFSGIGNQQPVAAR